MADLALVRQAAQVERLVGRLERRACRGATEVRGQERPAETATAEVRLDEPPVSKTAIAVAQLAVDLAVGDHSAVDLGDDDVVEASCPGRAISSRTARRSATTGRRRGHAGLDDLGLGGVIVIIVAIGAEIAGRRSPARPRMRPGSSWSSSFAPVLRFHVSLDRLADHLPAASLLGPGAWVGLAFCVRGSRSSFW